MVEGEEYKGPFTKKIEAGKRHLHDYEMFRQYATNVVNLAHNFAKNTLRGEDRIRYKDEYSDILVRAVYDLNANKPQTLMEGMKRLEKFLYTVAPSEMDSVGDGYFDFDFIPLEEYPEGLLEEEIQDIVVEGPDKRQFVLFSHLMEPKLESHRDNLPEEYLDDEFCMRRYEGPYSVKIRRLLRIYEDSPMGCFYVIGTIVNMRKMIESNLSDISRTIYQERVLTVIKRALKAASNMDYLSALENVKEAEMFANTFMPEKIDEVGKGLFILRFERDDPKRDYGDRPFLVEGPDGRRFIRCSIITTPVLNKDQDNLPKEYLDD